MFEVELVAHSDIIQPIDSPDVALEYIEGSQVLLEGFAISGRDDLPSKV